MSLLETIEQDMRSAMREGNEVKKTTLRMVKADLLTEKAKTGKDLSEEISLEVVGRAAKKRKEAITEFKNAGRDDLADKEALELAVIEQYLPKQLTEEEITAVVEKKLAAMGTVAPNQTGRVMGEIMKELKGKADGTIVRKIVSAKLEGK
jgi:uncharacterized protein YqeY